MDERVLERAKERVAEAIAGSVDSAHLETALERSRQQIEALAATAAELEASIPGQVGDAVREGLRAEVLPVARHIAESRGLLNQAIRRLERLEHDLLAERHARVDDLALLVELVSSGWRGVEVRLEALERGLARLDPIATSRVVEDLPAPGPDAGGAVEHAAAA